MPNLTPSEYRELIGVALSPTVDADTADPDLETLFTPDTHRFALDPSMTIVRGARGVGKTVWFKVLQDARLRRIAAQAYELAPLRSLRTVSGYGNERRSEYPSPRTLRQLLANGTDPEDIWNAVVLNGLGHDVIGRLENWQEKISWTAAHPDEFDQAIRKIDKDASRDGETILVLFDALDRLHNDRALADRLIDGIMRVALELRLGTRNLRAKIFIRPDMFENAPLRFPDASKLVANATDLYWSPTNLYGLVFHQMGNARSPLAERFRAETGEWTALEDAARFVPPDDLVGDKARQQVIFTRLAGPYMGPNHRKGHTYTWLPNHLMDGAEQVSPRSFLSSLVTAARISGNNYGAHEHALHYEGIRAGVQSASQIRVREVREDMPWVATVVGALARLQVPVEEEVIANRWREQQISTQLAGEMGEDTETTGPRSETTAGLIQELMELGVMSRRADSRIDLPDVYRVAFNIGRRGGVKRVSR